MATDTTVKTRPNRLPADQLEPPFVWGELFAHDGVLCRYFGVKVHRTTPEITRTFQRSTIRTHYSDDWDPIILRALGQVLSDTSGQIYNGYGNWVRVDLTGSKIVELTIPVDKPKDGKEHTWKWTGRSIFSHYSCFKGYWEKDQFPRCSDCGNYHNPTFRHCESCGQPFGKSHKCPYA